MHLHEYQAKQLLKDYGIPVPAGRVVDSCAALDGTVAELGGSAWVLKAQVHAGGRGKAGGVVRADTPEQLYVEADRLLGGRLVTQQTGAEGLPVSALLLERTVDIERELYLGVLIDRVRERIVILASAAGGMEIEQVAAGQPEAIITEAVSPAAGLQPYQCRKIGFGLGLAGSEVSALTQILQAAWRLALDKDAGLVEINPLVLTREGQLIALDCKIDIDDNALYRHNELRELRDLTQEDPRESEARQHGLNYVTLDGDIACMVNGAGLAMATMDLIKLHGGEPANFLDVGGGATVDRVTEAFRLILSDSKVRAVLINIFGGIVRCDLIAQGIIQALQGVGAEIPVVVRLEGTNVEEGRQLLSTAGLNVIAVEDLTEAVRKVIDAAKRQG
jgi:succinyl-CoA synthetase beta subunit